MDYGVAALNQGVRAVAVTQVTLDPLEVADLVEALPVAGRSMPTTKRVSLAGQVVGDVAADKPGGSCECNLHCCLLPLLAFHSSTVKKMSSSAMSGMPITSTRIRPRGPCNWRTKSGHGG